MSQEALSDSNIKGWEILSFDKVKLQSTKFPIVIGKLRVIFYEELDHCTLYLNEWSFSLFKDLSVLKLFEDSHMPLVYLFQRDDGVDSLTFTEIPQLEAIKKFETILNHYARFEQNQEKLLRMDDNFLINSIEDKTIASFFPRENVI